MPTSNHVLWGEGLFLRPQHFQQQALHFESALTQTLHLSRANPWGIRKALIDTNALHGGLLRIETLNVLFRDGTYVEAPKGTPLPPARNIDEIDSLGTSAIIYICLPLLNDFGNNCANDSEGQSRSTRYSLSRKVMRDLYTDALEAEITVLQPNLRLMADVENRDGFHCVAACRIHKNAGGTWEVDEDFIPPLIEIAGNSSLCTQTRRLLDILLVKSKSLTSRHRESAKSIVEYGSSDIASFWLLHTVNRAFPLLNHLNTTPTHPEVLYEHLAQLCGELMTFSSTLTLSDIPAYRHENLEDTFKRLDQLIRELLDTVVSNRYALIPLENQRPSFFIGHLNSERLIDNVDYYLSVSGELPTAEILEKVPLKLKAGSPDDVEKILNSALPGVRLAHAAQTPSALPVRVGNHYFVLEPQGQIFERMRQARSICIYVPQTLLGLKLELFAVYH